MRRLFTLLSSAAIGMTAFVGSAAAQDTEVDLSSQFISPHATIDASSDANVMIDWQALLAHPCYNAVGSELADCAEKFQLDVDLQTLMEDNQLLPLLQRTINERLCPQYTGTANALCRQGVLLPQDINFLNEKVDMNDILDTSNTQDEFLDDLDTRDLPTTTRDHAQTLLEERESGDVATQPHERSKMLWELCAESSVGQTTCFSNHFRFVQDSSIDIDDIRSIVR